MAPPELPPKQLMHRQVYSLYSYLYNCTFTARRQLYLFELSCIFLVG